MRQLLVALIALVGIASCGTKKNPSLCCNTAGDCAAVGLSAPTPCSDGLLCRGNQCIAESCATGSDCDASVPFCEGGMCAGTCIDDSQCPGFGADPADRYCVNGGCVTCRMGMSDCPATAPVCESGACRGCKVDDECASQVCDVGTGACVVDTAIRYASPSGSSTSDCSLATPCTLARAVSLADAQHPTVRALPGSYSGNITTVSSFTLVGTGATTTGGINSDVGLSLVVRGLTAAGFSCQNQGTLSLRDVVATSGNIGYGCQLTVTRSKFEGLFFIETISGSGTTATSIVASSRI